jgi:flagellar biosynthesis chaperone FliJ
MKKRNPIATLLRLREIHERKARVDLTRAQADVQREEANVAERRARLLHGITSGQDLPPAMLRSLHLRGLDSAEQVEAAARELESARQRFVAERGRWQEAAADLDATSELERRNRRAHAAKARTAAERSLDEVMAARYRKRSGS